MRIILSLCCAVLLAACAPRGQITLDPAAATLGDARPIFVGTTRQLDPVTGQFTSARSAQVDYARLTVSVPPDRALGTITYPPEGQKPNAAKDFLTTAEALYPGPTAFRAALAKALAARPAAQREAMVYVHGFNNTFAESVYRLAQISHDLAVPAVPVAYAWPSAANPLAYAYDRDSVLFARDGLERLLTQIARAGARRILLVGHSVGSELVMEVLRQMRLDGNRAVMSRLSGVVLISPDLDVDVFRSEALRIGHLPQPFVIFTSRRDRALALAARLTGERQRLGNLTDLKRLEDLKVTVLEVSAFSQGVGHFTAATSPALIRILQRVNDLNQAYALDPAARLGLLPGAVLSVRKATQVVLIPRGAP